MGFMQTILDFVFKYLPEIFCCLLACWLLIYIFSPSRDVEGAVEKTRLLYLHERKDVVYENLRDLNFEHKAGKFTEADFEAMRNSMEAEAARILAEIEQLEAAQA
ncbi:MAG TPA: hypothetical protein VHA33_27535 [Candidatus Angelobacter sp.]|jgi:hypothetical protein|nr:hypothetical protein [Candidatus Angelobacter sp.]